MFLIGLLLPKSKNIWIFGSWFGDYYIDNSKYLFEYVDNNENAITPIWLTRNKLVLQYLRNEGKRCYYIKSFLGFYYTARSSVVIVSQGLVDINKLGVSNQIKVLLWHGSPIKKIAYDDRKNANPYNQLFFKVILKTWNIFFPFERENWDIITASSKEVKNKFISAFKSTKQRVKILGYPRYDIIMGTHNNILKNIQPNKKVILYAPTFRDNNYNYNYFDGLNIQELNKIMEEFQAIFLINLHPKEKNHNYFINDNDNIVMLQNQDIDINKLLTITDILITDYSSIYIDFLLLNRPIIFTPFDLVEYRHSNRELYYDYELITPGERCNNWENTLEEIKKLFDGKDEYSNDRELIRKRFHTNVDNQNSSRIINSIKELNG